MRSSQLELERYDTDKKASGYLPHYDRHFQYLVDEPVKLLEVGVRRGGSLLMWRDYFRRGTITGIDLQLPTAWSQQDRISLHAGSQADTRFLSEVAEKAAPDGFDIIIDDASHIGHLTKVCFWHLFDHHLKPSGWYVIEDWGTGYWDDWPDGRTPRPQSAVRAKLDRLLRPFHRNGRVRWQTHNYGMVGFIKELVDEQGAGDLTRGNLSGTASRRSKFDGMTLYPGIVFIKKSA